MDNQNNQRIFLLIIGTMSRKQLATKQYLINKLHNKNRKDQEKDDLKELTKSLKQMSHELLFTFLQTKYDKLKREYPNFQQKMNYTIAGTIRVRTKQFQQQLKDSYHNYIFQNWGKKLNTGDYEKAINPYPRYLNTKIYQPHDCHLKWTIQQNIRILNMQSNYSWGQKRGPLTKFMGQPLPKQLFYQIDMKRAKKSFLQLLEKIISYKKKIYKILH